MCWKRVGRGAGEGVCVSDFVRCMNTRILKMLEDTFSLERTSSISLLNDYAWHRRHYDGLL